MLLLLTLNFFPLYSTVYITEFKQMSIGPEKWQFQTIIIFSNCEKYIVLCAGMSWENLLGYMLSSLFTHYKVVKRQIFTLAPQKISPTLLYLQFFFLYSLLVKLSSFLFSACKLSFMKMKVFPNSKNWWVVMSWSFLCCLKKLVLSFFSLNKIMIGASVSFDV